MRKKSISRRQVTLAVTVISCFLVVTPLLAGSESPSRNIKKKTPAPVGFYLTKVPGKGIRFIGSKGNGPGQFGYFTGLDQGPDGSLYVSDSGNARVEKFTWDGKFVQMWGSVGSGNGQFLGMRGVAIGLDGMVYVNDGINFRIQKFSSTGQYISAWGDNAKQWQPQAIDVGADGNIYLSDTFKNRVQIFMPDGSLVRIFEVFEGPLQIGVGPDNSVYLPDSPYVLKYSNTGKELKKWGGFSQFGQTSGIAVSADGMVYVADPSRKKINQFDANGGFIRAFGSEGSTLGHFLNPQYITAANDGSLYVWDASLFKIQHLVGGTFRATGATTTISGRILLSISIDISKLSVRIEGVDPKSKIAFYLVAKPASDGSFSFVKYPVSAKYKLVVSGFDGDEFQVSPVSRKGRAKTNNSSQDFIISLK